MSLLLFQITTGDVISVLPFNNDLLKVNISGREIRDVLEWSVRTLEWSDISDLRGAFLQLSGLQVSLWMLKKKIAGHKLCVG